MLQRITWRMIKKMKKNKKEGKIQIQNTNTWDTDTSPEPKNTQEQNGMKSAKQSNNTLQLIKNSLFYSKKKAADAEISDTVKRKKAAKSIQNAIGYHLMYENGICDLGDGRYSVSIGFDDINYQSASKEDQLDIFQRYCELLEYYSPDVKAQITILNRYINEEAFKKSMLLNPVGDQFDPLRKERNIILLQQSVHSSNNVVSDKYITITIKADSYKKAHSEIKRLIADTQQNFKNLGCRSEELSGISRLACIYDFFHPFSTFRFEYKNLLYSNLTTKDSILPDSLQFYRTHFTFDNLYGCVLYIRDFPSSITDNFIKDLSGLNLQMSINLHVNSINKSSALDLVDSQIAKMETRELEIQRKAAKYNDVPLIPRELQYSIDEAEELRKAINEAGMKMFKSTIVVTVVAESNEKLKDNIERVKGISRQHGCELSIATFLQKEGLNSSLLLGNNQLENNIQRTLTSASAGIFIPFTTQELFQPGGIYYGLNRESHNVLSFNRKTLKNPNGVVLGTPGSGKSFTSKREAFDVFLSTNDSVIILDPEREYSPLTELINGQNVYLSLSSKNYINPFEINENYADSDNPISLKADFIISMIQLIAGGKVGLSEMALSIIDRCVDITYFPYFSGKTKNMPTFPDFWKVLKSQPEDPAKELAVSIERYVTGNLSLFSHQSSVNLNNRFICFDVRDLGKQLKKLGMLICLDFIWNKITENREKGIRTWLYFDEFYLFFQDDYSAQFFFELWKRARKWGAIPTGITQNVEDLLLSDTARRILSNTEFAVLLNNAASDRQELAHIFNLSSRQLGYITNTLEGQGLIIAGKNIVPFEDKFPKDTNIYKVLTTKPEEVMAIRGDKK